MLYQHKQTITRSNLKLIMSAQTQNKDYKTDHFTGANTKIRNYLIKTIQIYLDHLNEKSGKQSCSSVCGVPKGEKTVLLPVCPKI